MTRVGFGTHPRLALALLFLAMVLDAVVQPKGGV